MEDTPEKYQKPRKRFHRSDALVYCFNEVELPFLKEGPDNYNTFFRQTRLVYASKDVTWQDVAAEVLHKMNIINDARYTRIQSIETENQLLLTCAVEYDEFIVALTLGGFKKVLEGLPSFGPYSYKEQVEDLAMELVAQRDYELYRWLTPHDQQTKSFGDFWPSKGKEKT